MKKKEFPINEELKKNLIKIAKKFNLNLLILFGSRARGDFTKDSDWDFAYLSKKNWTDDLELKLYDDLIFLFQDEKIDLVNLNKNFEPVLRFEIFMEGFLIYEKQNGLFFELRGNAFLNYEDHKYLFKHNLEVLKNKLKMV